MIQEHRASEFFIIMAAVVIVLAGIKSATVIIEPFLLSLFITIIFAPFFGWLNKQGLPSGISLAIVVALIIFIISLMGVLVGSSIDDFSNNMPYYEERLHVQFQSLLVVLDNYGIEVPKEEIGTIFDTNKLMKVAAGGLKSLGGMLTNGLVIILTVVFMLLESMDISKKLDKADGEKNASMHLGMIVDKIKNIWY
jgi:predicted PurR-regulated permease PerM